MTKFFENLKNKNLNLIENYIMCLAVPGKIKKIEGKKVLLDYPDEKRYALIGDEKIKVGDYVMVQMGIIVKILSQPEARSALEAWRTN